MAVLVVLRLYPAAVRVQFPSFNSGGASAVSSGGSSLIPLVHFPWFRLRLSLAVTFTPTVEHCSMATIIGLRLRVKLMRSLPPRFKVGILLFDCGFYFPYQVNKQLNDKERVAAALENPNLVEMVDECIEGNPKGRKRAEFQPYTNPPLYFTSANNYLKDTTFESKERTIYYMHGYNLGDRHGNILVTHTGNYHISNLFNEDNVRACNII
ncbi:hypothetical protein MLD38_021298 [Melastoma candidum]|uniref:Uncharacterized protein n=1 Tax=Melastoma candidum TaxID=119954 RepID=A0ACB9QNS4_9MYRT|nr:hypothetical protein MLD38_021298 [Melastoma candidum]